MPGPPATDPAAPEVSALVVSSNQRELLAECLEALLREPPPFAMDVWVLDNASDDGSAAAVRERFAGRVHLVALNQRRGKAENDTDLLERSRGRFCLLLNGDSEVLPGCVEALHAALVAHPEAAAAGAALLDPAGARQHSAWRFPTPGTALAAALFLDRLGGGRLSAVQSRGEDVRAVDWAQSACLLVRREAFEQVGGLDPAFFVYSDEVDWQRRMHDAGWSGLYVPQAHCTHHEQLATGSGAERRITEFARNRDRYVRKHEGAAAALAVRVLTAWTYALRALAALALPGHDARRYWLHARRSLFPARGEGIREAAEAWNRAHAAGGGARG